MKRTSTRRQIYMDKSQIIELISAQKTAFIASVNEQGFPVIRARLAPRIIDGSEIYFSTNTSSKKLSSTQQTIKLAYIFTSAANSNIKGYV